MKKLGIAVIIAAAALPCAAADTVVHFFDSAICPACERARGELPQMASRHGARIRSYQLINKSGTMDETNRKNLAVMMSMLSSIDRKTGGAPFVMKDRRAYRFAAANGFPYYLNQVSPQTTVKVEMGVPVFIIGDRAFAGYNRFEIEKYLRDRAGKAR